ncbi:MAG: PolC-type DNA polymerase III [Clostridia bacterium]|nr:PolC-type DNA polymerase III [Clostridia bacterium]
MGKENTIQNVFKDYKTDDLKLCNAVINHFSLYKKSNKLLLELETENRVEIKEILNFEQYLYDRFAILDVDIKLKTKFKETLDIRDEWKNIIEYIISKSPAIKLILEDSKIEIENQKLIVYISIIGKDILEKKEIDKKIEQVLENIFAQRYKVSFIEKINEKQRNEYKQYMEKIKVERISKFKYNVSQNNKEYTTENAIINSKETPCKNKENLKSREGSSDKSPEIIFGRNFAAKEAITSIDSITGEIDKIVIQGEVVNISDSIIDIKKNNKVLISYDIYDRTNSITCKSFIPKEGAGIVLKRLKESKSVRVAGKAQFDNYTKEISIIANCIIECEGIKKIEREDKSEIKRVELHMHTQMSQMDGVSSAKSLVKRAMKWGMKSIAITDHGVVQAFPEVHKLVGRDNPDIKVIYGVEAYLVPDIGLEGEGTSQVKKLKSYHAIILAKNYVGLKNLYKLISISHLDFFYKKPRILKSIYMKYKEGLILGSACEAGELYRAIVEKKSDEEIENIAETYDYLEIQPIDNNMFMVRNETVPDRVALQDINKRIIKLADKLGKLTVATCDVHFLDPEDEIYRRILMAGQGYSDADEQAPLYLRTTEEMLEEFEYLGEEKAYEVVVTNTNKVADMCEQISPISSEKCPPHLPNCEEDIRNIAYSKAHELYGEILPDIVKERLDKELESIIKNGFSVMYIIAQKLVWKSNEDGYLVGSRGSVGSSFVANMTGITEVNSLSPHYRCPNCKYSDFSDHGVKNGFDLPDKECPKCGTKLVKDGMDIPFETFLGFNGDKEPDIDLNFSGEYQAKAHRYTEEIFGKGTTFKAGTIGTIADKTAIGFVKKYYEGKSTIISNAETLRIAKGCTGVKRTTGQHPGGIIVVPKGREIFEFCPVQHPADDSKSSIITTHFDYHSIDQNLLKLDILGHDDPTMIRNLQDLTGIDPLTVPLDDPDTMSIFRSPKILGVTPQQIHSEVGTFGVPEFGTKFVRGMLVDTKPSTFEELVRISGLSHGTDVWLNNAQDLINAGTVRLDEAICTRDDIMIYLIKKGLPPNPAFKIMESVRKGRGLTEEQENLMLEHGVPEWYIQSCKTIKYMFPKAHAVAYVMMAVRIAWFKVHYPMEYYSSFFSIRASQFDNEIMCNGKERVKGKMKEIDLLGNSAIPKDKEMYPVLELVLEMYERGIKFLPIDLYRSHSTKFQIEEGGIRPPLNSIQGLGNVAADGIESAKKDGKFMSIDDLKIRSKVGDSVIEMLNKVNCLTGLPKSNQISLF